MRKQVFYSFICLCLWWLMPACSDNEEEFTDTLTPQPESEAAFGQGLRYTESSSTQTLAFETGNAWTATLTGENASAWCRVNPIQGKPGKHTVSISVAQNGLEQERQALLTFSVGILTQNVSITQAAKAYVAPEGLSFSPAKLSPSGAT